MIWTLLWVIWCALAGIGLLAVLLGAWLWWDYRRMMRLAEKDFEI